MIEEVKGFVGIAFFVAFFVGVPVFCAWLVAKGIRTGVVRAKGFPYARADSPAYFWIAIAVYAVLALWLGRYGVLIGLDMIIGCFVVCMNEWPLSEKSMEPLDVRRWVLAPMKE